MAKKKQTAAKANAYQRDYRAAKRHGYPSVKAYRAAMLEEGDGPSSPAAEALTISKDEPKDDRVIVHIGDMAFTCPKDLLERAEKHDLTASRPRAVQSAPMPPEGPAAAPAGHSGFKQGQRWSSIHGWYTPQAV